MKKLIQSTTLLLLTLLFFGSLTSISSQNSDPFQLQELKLQEVPKSTKFFNKKSGKSSKADQEGIHVYTINANSIDKLYSNFSPLLEVEIPMNKNQGESYLYTEYNFFDTEFQVNLLNETEVSQLDIDRGIHLKGIIPNHPNSFSSLSLFKTGIYGLAKSSQGIDYSIMPLEPTNGTMNCIISNDSRLDWSMYKTACSTDDIEHYMGAEVQINARNTDNCKVISISVDVDYDLYLKFNKNTQSISNYVIGLFNNVHTLYKREGISISLNQINIHAAEDYFSHLSASSDLENFRRKYPNNNKTVKLLLSGYNKNNIAPLGGIGYIKTLCLQSYSYAYANVNGIFTDAPVYSWDVFLATHELGHVFGSRHTHACVWGPGKNQAIDNCAKLEGSCANPGIPAKGTIMSYCYSSGMPGIDFSEGFGKEPGDLIRSVVASSNCISSLTQATMTLNKENTEITSNTECTDGSYTHYYFDNNTIDPNDDILVLSVDKKGNDIGQIGEAGFSIKLITTKKYGSAKAATISADYIATGTQLQVINKYWEFNSNKKPTTPISIQYPIHAKDLVDLFGQNKAELLSKAIVFNILKPGSIDPETNHAKTSSSNFIYYSNSSKPVLNSFTISNSISDVYTLELLSNKFENTGVGFIQEANKPEPSGPFTEFNSFTANPKGPQNAIDFQTKFETGCSYFVIESSANGQSFDSIAKINAIGTSTITRNYTINIASKSNNKVYFRIRAVSLNSTFIFSQSISLQNDYKEDPGPSQEETLVIFPNPISNGKIQFKFNNTSTPQTLLVQVLDAYGRMEKMAVQVANSGINQYSIDASGLKPGLHYLNAMTRYGNYKMSFSIN